MARKSDLGGCTDIFMMFSAVGLNVLNSAALRLLCTIGSGAGFAGILLGLRSDRKAQRSSQESHSGSDLPDSSCEPSPAECCGTQEVIHLSTHSGPTKSSDMSQQQKIAAALTRAGITNSAAWSVPASSRATIGVMDPPPEPPIAADRTPDNVSVSEHSTLPRRIILLGGLVLFLLSLILFLAIR